MNKSKFLFPLLILSLFLFLLSGCGRSEENTSPENIIPSNTINTPTEEPEPEKQEVEEELASFTTIISASSSSARNHNISLSASELSGTRIEAGSTFSFTGTLGPATPEKGYKKADIYGRNGEILQDYGGRKMST